ncbi:MAG TPA: ATP-binding cassette domain-containing protein [Pseudonocardiaceae bacterium]
MTPTEPVLAARGLHRSFTQGTSTVDVLTGADIHVHAGELVALAGPSGSGKSVLFSLLCGFDRPTAGTIHLLGRPLPPQPAWQDCAVLPQTMGLADELTVAENVALPLILADPASHRAARTTALDLLAELGIDHLADRYPTELSFGQRQRTALARALAPRPTLLLADEPTAHLDHATTPVVVRLLRRAAQDGTAVLITTHDDEVYRAADRRLRLHQGRVLPG